VLGAIATAAVLYVIASGAPGFDVSKGFASNGFGEHSPGGYSMLAALVCEVVMTGFFLVVIMGATDERASMDFAPIAIGLCLTLIHLISIPVTNTSGLPGPLHRRGAVRGRLGGGAAAAVLGGAHRRRCSWRCRLSRHPGRLDPVYRP